MSELRENIAEKLYQQRWYKGQPTWEESSLKELFRNYARQILAIIPDVADPIKLKEIATQCLVEAKQVLVEENKRIEEAEKQERERMAKLIKTELLDRMEQEYIIRQHAGDISSMAVIKMLESRARCIWQALKEEK